MPERRVQKHGGWLWSGHPGDDIWTEKERLSQGGKWLGGNCSDFATALASQNPDLRFGQWVVSAPDPDDEDDTTYTPLHVFVHDDQYAYDGLGRHPLPYNEGGKDTQSVYDLGREDIEGQWGESDPDLEREAIAFWKDRHGELP